MPTTEPPTISAMALSVASPTRRPVPVIRRTAPDRTAPPSSDPQGLSLREKRELRGMGFTGAEIEFMNALAEINQMVHDFFERLGAGRGAPSLPQPPAA